MSACTCTSACTSADPSESRCHLYSVTITVIIIIIIVISRSDNHSLVNVPTLQDPANSTYIEKRHVTSVRFVKIVGVGAEGARIEAPKSPRGGAFFHFKIVHSGAFSYTNSKVLFARYTSSQYSWRLTVIPVQI